jgi:uncharacterized membrane protein/protein-disulfide isomerase
MSATRQKLLLAFSILGLAASSYSSYAHYKLLTDPLYTPACDFTEAVSCTSAYTSDYGSFMGVPVAPLGFLFFLFVLLMVAVGARPASRIKDSAPAYIFTASTLGLAFVLYLAWASYVVLKVFCPFCALTYVSVIAIFIISGGVTTVPMTKLPGRATKDLKTLVSNPVPLVLALLLLTAAALVITVFPRDTEGGTEAALPQLRPVTDQERASLAQWWEMQPKVTVPIPDGGAKVLVVKFNDYQCPACKATHELYKPVWAKHAAGGQVRYLVKHYPLEGECNPSVPTGNHYASCEAAAGVIMARSKGTAARLEDWIFANLGPPVLTPQQMKDGVRTQGGITDFDAQYPRAIEEIKADAGLGKLLGVGSTPTFFINGRKLPELVQPQYLDAIIELELQRPSK